MSCILNNIAQKLIHSIHQEIVCDLITCMRPPSVNFDIECTDVGFCKDCMGHLLSLYVLKSKSGCMNSVKCTICCIKNICINSFPFCYIQAYFSDNITDLLTNFSVFLKYLKEIYTMKTCNSVLSLESDCFQNFKNMHSVSEDYGKESMSVKSILSLYATYAVYQGEEFFFYTDVDFLLLKEGDSNEFKSDFFKCGSVLLINNKINSYFCILFDINLLSRLKYHIMDYRILLSESSFYSFQVLHGHSVDLYRPLSLYPPTFVHDVSFYIDQNFNENDLFQVVRNAVGYLIKSVVLIDSYYNDVLQKHTKCYRFTYQSSDQVLSRSKADSIHSKFIRKVLEKSLNISLR